MSDLIRAVRDEDGKTVNDYMLEADDALLRGDMPSFYRASETLLRTHGYNTNKMSQEQWMSKYDSLLRSYHFRPDRERDE